MHEPIITGILLGIATLLASLCALGVLVMRDPLQRLHFSAPVVSWSAGFIAIAVWIEENDAQARIKIVLIFVILLVMNSILTHATARAIRIRQGGHWPVRPDDHIPIMGQEPLEQHVDDGQGNAGFLFRFPARSDQERSADE